MMLKLSEHYVSTAAEVMRVHVREGGERHAYWLAQVRQRLEDPVIRAIVHAAQCQGWSECRAKTCPDSPFFISSSSPSQSTQSGD
jgi:hypothetical protein